MSGKKSGGTSLLQVQQVSERGFHALACRRIVPVEATRPATVSVRLRRSIAGKGGFFPEDPLRLRRHFRQIVP